MVWVAFQGSGGQMVATGAPVGGLADIGNFTVLQTVPGSTGGNFGGIEISPDGQVSVTYQIPTGDIGPSTIFVQTDPDGFGPFSFGIGGTRRDYGTVFKVTTNGLMTPLVYFDDGTNGGFPSGGLIRASDGNPFGFIRIAATAGTRLFTVLIT